MPKWKLFIWKLWHNGLATKENLYHRMIGNSTECPICLNDIEDTHHLLRSCPLALEVWAHRQLGMDQNIGNDLLLPSMVKLLVTFLLLGRWLSGELTPGFFRNSMYYMDATE